ncbi:IS3 family transposase [Bacillus sp. Xin]|nr:IS3 family transposase [Bacillus sp. Xin]NSW35760.1 IS3 family transposase [Bacillus sp. Xin1]
MKGYTCNNAMFKVFKTGFDNETHFTSLEQLILKLNDYVH